MKSLHPARKRLLLGILFVLTAFFYAFAPTCGLIGQLLSRASTKLIGQTGTTLLTLGFFVMGVLFILPHDSLGRLFRWALHGRQARVAKVVRESDGWVRAEGVKRIVAAAIKAHEELKEVQAAPAPNTNPAVRRKLDDVRTALKNLGYVKGEIEPLVQGMDPTATFEVLVKGALKELRKETN